jgi:hypothetical protein
MSDLQPVEVTVRLGGDDKITRAVVIDEPERRFAREVNESLPEFQARVRAAAAERGICWGGLSDWE